MTIEEANDKRVNAIEKYIRESPIKYPFSKNDIENIIRLLGNIIQTYHDTESLIPINGPDKAYIDILKEQIEQFKSDINHPAFI